MESDHLPEKMGFRWRARRWLRASHTMMWGLAIAAMSLEPLLNERFPHLPPPWRGVVVFIGLLACLWMFVSLSSSLSIKYRDGDGMALLFALGVGLMASQADQTWAVFGMGAVMAAYFWAMAMVYQRSAPVPLAVIGWLFAGVVVLFIPWPNSQRFWLVFVLGGLGTALQGGIDLTRHWRDIPRQVENTVADNRSMIH